VVVLSASDSGAVASPAADVGSTSAESDEPNSSASASEACVPSNVAQYVLHPPLPAVASSSSDQLSAIPLLLNPDILHSSKIPVITPQLAQVLFLFITDVDLCRLQMINVLD